MELTVQMKVIFAIMKQRNSSKPRRKAFKGNRIQDDKDNTEMPKSAETRKTYFVTLSIILTLPGIQFVLRIKRS